MASYQRSKKSKSFGGFWSNLFHSSERGTNKVEAQSSSLEVDRSGPLPLSKMSTTRVLSSDSLNTIQSTHSFAFVKAEKAEKRRGRRIPVEFDDNHFRHKPQKQKEETKTKFGFRLSDNLKFKYNLQSCESLATATLAKGQVPPGNCSGQAASRRISATPSFHRRPALAYRCKKNPFQNSGKSAPIISNQGQVDPVLVKRRAPPPPFRIANVEINTLDAPAKKCENRHRRCQSDTTACEQRFKPKAHVEGKRRAPLPPQLTTEQVNSTSLDPQLMPLPNSSEMPRKKVATSPAAAGQYLSNGQCHSDQKPLPRPWYKRNSNLNKNANRKPTINLPNFSKLDQEAAQIVLENKRRSAEISYNQSAKELITMFNTTFANPETEPAKESNVVTGKEFPPNVTQVKNSCLSVEPEEKKKLAIVQPQKSESGRVGKQNLQNGQSSSPTTSLTQVIPPSLVSRVSYTPSMGESWTCSRCTLTNFSWKLRCDACLFRKTTSEQTNQSTRPPLDLAQNQSVTTIDPNEPGHVPRNESHEVTTKRITEPDAFIIIQQKERISTQKPSKDLPPLCQNFLSQVPDKENLQKEKLDGLKLLEAQTEAELDIEALREARVAFFTKNTASSSIDANRNNLTPIADGCGSTEVKELNLRFLHDDKDLELVEFLLKVHQELELETTGISNTSNSQSPSLRPIYKVILDSDNFEQIYDDVKEFVVVNKSRPPTNTFVHDNIKLIIQNQAEQYKTVMERRDDVQMNLNPTAWKTLTKEAWENEVTSKENARIYSSLLRKVDMAITRGEFHLAAQLAYEFASLQTKLSTPKEKKNPITIRVYVEDRMMQQGPFTVSVTEGMTVKDLKTKIDFDWSIPINFQKWILGKEMAENDDDLLSKYKIQNESLAFLYLVTPPEFQNAEGAKAGVSMPKPPAPCQTVGNLPSTSQIKAIENAPKDQSPLAMSSSENTPGISTQMPEEVILVSMGATIEAPISNNQFTEQIPPPIATHHQQNSLEIADVAGANPQRQANSALHLNISSTIDVAEIPEVASLLDLPPTRFEEKHADKQVTRNSIPKSKVTSKMNSLTPPPSLKFSLAKQSGALATTSTLFSRRSSFEDQKILSQNSKSQLPFTRRLSGSLTKQIQMFEALTSLKPAQSQKSDETPMTATTSVTKHFNVAKRRSESEEGASGDLLQEPTNENYKKLLELEKSDLIHSDAQMECPVCLAEIEVGKGVILRECLHAFCEECLTNVIEYSEDAQVKCPYRDNDYTCDRIIQDREIKALVPTDIFNRLLAKSVKLAECKMANTFHCKTADCLGWCVFEDTVNIFRCPVCLKSNCLNCQAIHENLDCQQYQRQLAIAAETDDNAKSSRIMLEKMIERGEALDCPACHVVLLKKWGCDWVRCSYCKTEICWVTKSFRWGPNGKGDTTGGCKCGVNGVKCHPKCTYCH